MTMPAISMHIVSRGFDDTALVRCRYPEDYSLKCQEGFYFAEEASSLSHPIGKGAVLLCRSLRATDVTTR